MARRFEEGVRFYTRANVDIYFPENEVYCRLCPLFGTEYGTRRDYCKRTGEPIPEPDSMIGGYCPLKFDKEGEDAEQGKTGPAEGAASDS